MKHIEKFFFNGRIECPIPIDFISGFPSEEFLTDPDPLISGQILKRKLKGRGEHFCVDAEDLLPSGIFDIEILRAEKSFCS
jgi:hypothetical protein